jgi:hypothetical protein
MIKISIRKKPISKTYHPESIQGNTLPCLRRASKQIHKQNIQGLSPTRYAWETKDGSVKEKWTKYIQGLVPRYLSPTYKNYILWKSNSRSSQASAQPTKVIYKLWEESPVTPKSEVNESPTCRIIQRIIALRAEITGSLSHRSMNSLYWKIWDH